MRRTELDIWRRPMFSSARFFMAEARGALFSQCFFLRSERSVAVETALRDDVLS